MDNYSKVLEEISKASLFNPMDLFLSKKYPNRCKFTCTINGKTFTNEDIGNDENAKNHNTNDTKKDSVDTSTNSAQTRSTVNPTQEAPKAAPNVVTPTAASMTSGPAKPKAQKPTTPVTSGPIIANHIPDEKPPKTPISDNGDGTVSVDMSSIVQIGEEVSPVTVQQPEVQQANTNNHSPNFITPNPKIQQVQQQYIEPGAPKTKNFKSDIVNATPGVQVVNTPSQETEVVDVSAELLKNYPILETVSTTVGNQFTVKYHEDGGLVIADVYSKDDPTKKLDNMSMVIDVAGNIFDPRPKFWAGDVNSKGNRADFTAPITLTEKGVEAYLSGEPINKNLYMYNDKCAQLNKVFMINSIESVGVKNKADKAVILKTIDKAFSHDEMKTRFSDRRLIMKEFKDKDNFTLMTAPNTPEYLNAKKKPNFKKEQYEVVFANGNVDIKEINS